MRRLFFEDHRNRLQTIVDTHADTCEWAMETAECREWMEVNESSPRHDLLWVKGKPGAGKSTLMKHIQEAVTAVHGKDNIVSFYFNARAANPLEHNTEGLYRSLIYQILVDRPKIAVILEMLSASGIATIKTSCVGCDNS